MPELPEVETVRRSLLTYVKHTTIEKVEVLYPKIIENMSPEEFSQKLVGEVIEDIKRRGKYLIFQLSHYDLISHLRMEGKYFVLSKEDPIGKHTHVIFQLDNKKELRYDDVRKFGRMSLVPKGTALEYKTLKTLGPEPFIETFSLEDFSEKLKASKKEIKPLLLNQKVVTGLGNIYVDEALFASKIHPLRKADSLNEEEVKLLHQKIIEVLQKAIEKGGSTIKSYHTVNGKEGSFQTELHAYGQEGKPCSRCQSIIQKIKVDGRGTHFCPTCQRLKSPKETFILGLTGSIATGKSNVSDYFLSLGIPVADGDLFARKVVEKGSPTLTKIVQTFGKEMLFSDGSLNRKKLGARVFSSPEELEKLNQITGKAILKLYLKAIKEAQKKKEPLIVLDIPLLFEAGYEKYVDEIMVVALDKTLQIERLMARDNISKEEASKKIASQWSIEEKVKKADVVIDSSGSKEETRKQVANWLEYFYK